MVYIHKIIDKALLNSLEIHCVDICLTQQIDKNPIIYKGSGSIYQDKKGSLQFKIYSRKTNNKDTERKLNFQYNTLNTSGKIIESTNYFTIKAVDIKGNEWCAKDILIDRDGDLIGSYGYLIYPISNIRDIKSITKTEGSSNGSYLHVIIPGIYDIPSNKTEPTENGGWCLNKTIFCSNNIQFEIKKNNNYLEILVKSGESNINQDIYLKLIEAVSIFTGYIIRPLLIKYTENGKSVLKIMSLNKPYYNDKKVNPPFKHYSKSEINSFITFVDRYINNIEYPFSDLYGFWHKINRAWQSSMDNSSLAISVAIEGLIKSYFKELGKVDDEILKQAENAKEIIEQEKNLSDRIKNRILCSIKELNNISTKSALENIYKKKLPPGENLTKKWIKLRNKSVHPDNPKKDLVKLQKYSDLISACLTLFYQIIFLIIKYEGTYVDYSKEGCPERIFYINK